MTKGVRKYDSVSDLQPSLLTLVSVNKPVERGMVGPDGKLKPHKGPAKTTEEERKVMYANHGTIVARQIGGQDLAAGKDD